MDRKKFFGRFVKAKRLEAKLTMEQMAERCNMSVRGYADVEMGESDPKLSTVVKIADALQLDMNYFVTTYKKSTLRSRIDAETTPFDFSLITYRSHCNMFMLRGFA